MTNHKGMWHVLSGVFNILKLLGIEIKQKGWFQGSLRFAVLRSHHPVIRPILKSLLQNDYRFEWIINKLALLSNRNPRPVKVYAESTNACNAKCIMCPRDEMTRKIGIMDLNLFKKIVDQCVDAGVQELRFHNYGEVMIDPNLGEKIKYAKTAGIPVTALYTNGSLLTEKISHQILDAGLDKMFVSIDGTDRETFERIRLRLKYDDVSGNLKRFLEIRKARGQKNPFTEIVLLPIYSQNGEVEKFKQAWQGLVDNVRVSEVHDFAGQGTDEYRNGKTPKKFKRIPCYMLWRDMYILWNGQVTLCSLDFDGKTNFGSIQKSSLKQLWCDSPINSVRRQHLNREWEKLPLCHNCHVNVYWDFDSKLQTLRLWL